MFYISRTFTGGAFVIDTDDDSEEKLSYSEIREAVLYSGIDIKGVIVDRRDPKEPSVTWEVYRYHSDAKSAKALMLNGIKVQVNDENIVTNFRAMQDGVVFRVSDYGVGLGDYAVEHSGRNCTIILDDKLTYLTKYSIENIGYNAKLDISERSDADVVYDKYFKLMDTFGVFTLIDNNRQRYNKMMTFFMMTGKIPSYKQPSDARYSEEGEALFLKKYKKNIIRSVPAISDLIVNTKRKSYINEMYQRVNYYISLNKALTVNAQIHDNLKNIPRYLNLQRSTWIAMIGYIGMGGEDNDIYLAYRKTLKAVAGAFEKYIFSEGGLL